MDAGMKSHVSPPCSQLHYCFLDYTLQERMRAQSPFQHLFVHYQVLLTFLFPMNSTEINGPCETFVNVLAFLFIFNFQARPY